MKAPTLNFQKISLLLSHSVLLPVLVVLLGLLVAVLILTVRVDTGAIASWVDQTGWRPRSTVEISQDRGQSSESGRLVFKFKIVDRDRAAVDVLSQRLGFGSDWQNGLSISLNSQSLDRIGPLLPVKLNLNFKQDQIDFGSGRGVSLNSSLPERDYRYATGGGELKLKGAGVSQFNLSLVEPGRLLSESSRSGQLYLSKQLAGLITVLEKVAGIEMNVNGKNISGQIRLKRL